jgi:two-component system OmpR family sensor kinase
MGRLYWRFFRFFWLAQVSTALVMAAAAWLLRVPPLPNLPLLPPPHPPAVFPLLVPMLIGGVISLLFAALMASYVTRPIRRLDAGFKAIADGRLDERIGDALGGSRDELTALGSGFDRMASRLQALVESQRRLLHDVSHEIRAPLARMQAAVDLMDRAPERREELTARLHTDIERAGRLVNELLTLARLEGGGTVGPLQGVILNDLLENIADDARFDAGLKDCDVRVLCPPDLEIQAHPELLHRAVDNVMRNAVRHAPSGSVISLQAIRVEARVLIDVEDQGEGVAARDLANLFDPFFRGAGERDEGYGLGLAISRRAIDAHAGSISASNLAAGGFRISIQLPA